MENAIKINDNIVNIPIEHIVPHNSSHKTRDVIELLKESIKKYGITQPISVDENNVIVTGNGVYFAAKELGKKELPCVVLDYLPKGKIAEYRMADNLTGGFAKWNEDKLKKELSYLQELEELQFCFDENLRNMLLPKNFGIQCDMSTNREADILKTVNLTRESKEKEEQRFREELKNKESGMTARPKDYFHYTCSRCGKTVVISK